MPVRDGIGFDIINPITTENAATGQITLGGQSTNGEIVLQDNSGDTRILLNAEGQALTIQRGDGTHVVELGPHGDLILGGGSDRTPAGGQDGDLVINSASGDATIHLDGSAMGRFGGSGADGRATFFRAEETSPGPDTKATIYVNGDRGNIRLGGNDVDGRMAFFQAKVIGTDLYDYNGKATVQIQGSNGDIRLGGNGQDGDLFVNNGNGDRTIQLDGEGATARFGGAGANGRATFFHADEANPTPDTNATIYVNGERGNIRLGGNGVDGRMAFFRSAETGTDLYDYDGKASIQLQGSTGDIILQNADCAEDFDVCPNADAEPGTVMVINADGRLEPSTMAYDKRVAGVVSGAGEYQPGLVLDRHSDREDRLPIAMLGKVYCQADADIEPIGVGDLLTTSPTCGHAMRALDPSKAFGTVIGKALKPLGSGQSMIPILVTLQ